MQNARNLEKLCRIWSTRRERPIDVKVEYRIRELDGCKVVDLRRVEEMR